MIPTRTSDPQGEPGVVGVASTRTFAPLCGASTTGSVAHVDADVGHVVGPAAEEEQVSGIDGVARAELGGGVVLVLGHPGQA